MSNYLNRSSIELIPPSNPISGSITLSGSKSFTNRALIIASLANGESDLRGVSDSEDTELLIDALENLGVLVNKAGSSLVVCGSSRGCGSFSGSLDVRAAGTTMRFLISLCAVLDGVDVTLCGTERMHQRPVRDLVEAWRSLGVSIEYLGKEGCPPIRIRGNSKLKSNFVKMNGRISSQYFTSLLLVAPMISGGLTIEVDGELASKSYIDMTIASMKEFGVEVENENYRMLRVPEGSEYKPGNVRVEGDASGASYFWGLAAVSTGKIRVRGVAPGSLQGDARFPELLEEMGCDVNSGIDGDTPWIEVSGRADLQATSANMSLMPDTAQTLSVVAGLAKGKTEITGLETLRHKETDRLNAVQNELARLGVFSETTDDSIVIEGGHPHGALISTYEDHRMAMSFAILAAKITGIQIKDPGVVVKSFPTFWSELENLGMRII